VSDRVTMILGDIFEEDFSSATVLTLFLGNELNRRLAPTILKMRAGTRVVSNLFDMGDWEPDRVVRVPEQNPVFLWVVPAALAGEWEVSGLPGSSVATLVVAQNFQKIEGRWRTPGGPTAPVRGRLDGSRLAFEYEDRTGALRRIVAEVHGDTFRGRATPHDTGVVSGRRVR